MGADYDHLRAFMLASTRMHLGNRYAISLLRTQIKTLEDRMQAIAPAEDPEMVAALKEVRTGVDEAFSTLDERADTLLSALEKYVNG